jgi:protein-tyrosine phosphatase
MFKRILIVCVGNICRSPTAEYLLRDRLGKDHGAQVGSAGLGAMAGCAMDTTSLALLREHGVNGEAHCARQLDSALLRQSDLILAMEKSHVAAMVRMAPEASGKIFLLDRWLDGRDIPDPYRQQRPAYEHVYGLIEQGVNSWLRYL